MSSALRTVLAGQRSPWARRTRVLAKHVAMAGEHKAALSTTAGDETTVLVERRGGAHCITLNRAKKLNALTLGMVRELTDALRSGQDAAVVVLQGAGGKAFCAGGDVAGVHKAGLEGGSLTRDFFFEEYRLNAMIGQEGATPQVSIWDGITMGGGIGLSVHGRFRVCTEKALFAKPETAIGLFPDVGGSHFLGKLPHNIGTYIALTGARLKAADLMFSGVATHFVESERVSELVDNLTQLESSASESDVEAVINNCSSTNVPDAGNTPIQQQTQVIADCFGHDEVEAILTDLDRIAQAGDGDSADFAGKTLSTMRKVSPTSLKLTLEQVRRGAELANLEECLRMEYRIVQHIVQNTDSDFFEGVRAVLIDKTHDAAWSPATVEEVSRAVVESHFEPLADSEELHFRW